MASSDAQHALVQRVAMTLDIKPELVKEYIAAHATPRQQVVDALRSVGLRNLSLWVSRERLFYYAEFVPIGNETFDEAMARYALMPGVKEWEQVRKIIKLTTQRAVTSVCSESDARAHESRD